VAKARNTELLQLLPPVGDVLAYPQVACLIEKHGRGQILDWARRILEQYRTQFSAEAVAWDFTGDRAQLTELLAGRLVELSRSREQTRLRPVINATGVILHTGLGRAPLAQTAAAAVMDATQACNLELDLESGTRRHRGYQLEDAWRTLTGAEASLVVNNNAAATLLALQALCAGREVIISRGQLIEIGGSFRLPEIFALSGAILREVGTTNQTHLSDYERAITPQTAAIFRVHPSNYRVLGFADTPGIAPLAALAHEHGLIAIDDIGSGCLADLSDLAELPAEPTFGESLAADADLVLGSGDKLLGGPQCGILLGRQEAVDKVRQHPLARAVRIDKLTLAALAATLDIYLQGHERTEIPVLSFLSSSATTLRDRALNIQQQLIPAGPLSIDVRDATSAVGGGSLPAAELPTAVLALRHATCSAEDLARRLRLGPIRIMGRCQQDQVLLDLRSVAPADDVMLILALQQLAADGSRSSLCQD
jgi:L-seryl-tRNA(Ser) seleniumtransferase